MGYEWVQLRRAEYDSIVWDCTCVPIDFGQSIPVFATHEFYLPLRNTFVVDAAPSFVDMVDLIMAFLKRRILTEEERRYVVAQVYEGWLRFLDARDRDPSVVWLSSPDDAEPTTFAEAFGIWFHWLDLRIVDAPILEGRYPTPDEFISYYKEPVLKILGYERNAFTLSQVMDASTQETWITLSV